MVGQIFVRSVAPSPAFVVCLSTLILRTSSRRKSEISGATEIEKRPCLLCCFLYTHFVFGSMFLFRNMEGHQQIIL